jgi:PIN domain nuclease of toxin-antitoxin system
MRLLLDTHTLLWSASESLPKFANEIVNDFSNQVYFSVLNLWEIELKNDRLQINLQALRNELLERGYCELPITSRHVFALSNLPNLHRDPFDRILLAQALSEKLQLVSADKKIGEYADKLDCVLYYES